MEGLTGPGPGRLPGSRSGSGDSICGRDLWRRLPRRLHQRYRPGDAEHGAGDGAGIAVEHRATAADALLSGSSAGGINAIFLAKALANNQTMDRLRDLWITEGDISVLINDRMSLA